MIGLQHYLVVSAILFVMGVLGIFINRKNVIIILMAIELILLSVNINLVAFSAFLGDLLATADRPGLDEPRRIALLGIAADPAVHGLRQKGNELVQAFGRTEFGLRHVVVSSHY